MFASSRDVATYFEKRHDNVIRDVEGLIPAAPTIALNFEENGKEVKVGFGTRTDRTFDMTRKGFTLLAMRYTGAKALQFQIAYVDAFNRMGLAVSFTNVGLPNGLYVVLP